MSQTTEPSIGTLVRSALDDARELFREEVALAKAEIRQETSKITAAGTQFGAAAVALWFAAMFLLVAAALGISAVAGWPAWAGFLVVALPLGAAGVVFGLAGRRAVREVQPLPRTLTTLKENFR